MGAVVGGSGGVRLRKGLVVAQVMLSVRAAWRVAHMDGVAQVECFDQCGQICSWKSLLGCARDGSQPRRVLS